MKLKLIFIIYFQFFLLQQIICNKKIQEEQENSEYFYGRLKPEKDYPEKIIKPLKQIPIDQLPENFFWGDVNGTDYLTIAKNQFLPQYCGSCWAHGATSAMSDRIKIMRNATWPDIDISVQVLVSCAHGEEYQILKGCHGGYAYDAYRWISENNITDETCSSYHALGWNSEPEPLGCTSKIKCQNCNFNGECVAQENAKIYSIKEYGKVKGEQEMMNEIYQRGSITCGIASNPHWHNYTEGIYISPDNYTKTNHDVNVVGWGVENGTKFWWGRNFFGSYWGIHGYFKIIRGKYTANLAIEEDCHWAVPEDTWSDDQRNQTKSQESIQQSENEEFQVNPCYIPYDDSEENYEIQDQYLPPDLQGYLYRNLRIKNIPQQWDWRNTNGKNYLSWNVNAGVPKVCNSCWAFAATSIIADRIQILRGNAWPVIFLNPQVLINCKAGGTCKGGNSLNAFKYIQKYGVPEITCQQYIGEDVSEDQICTPIKICENSSGPLKDIHKWPQEYYQNWYIQEYGTIKGAINMKQEIYKNGPISCAIQSTQQLYEYKDQGIFQQKIQNIKLNAEITIVGYGVEDDGQEYWICRNFWGTSWGDFGFFKLNMYENNLGVENKCTWAKPILTY